MMMTRTHAQGVTPSELQLPVRREKRSDLLKAGPQRALVTTLEGLTFWSESPSFAAISADASVQICCVLGLFGNEPWPTEPAVVRASQKRLRGMDDERQKVPGAGVDRNAKPAFRALRQGLRAADWSQR